MLCGLVLRGPRPQLSPGASVSKLDLLRQSLQRAATALQGRRLEEVETTCAEIVRQNGEEANALMLLGLVRLERGDLRQGIAFLERARRASPNHVHVLSNLGCAYRNSGRLAEARRALEAAVAVEPGFAVAQHNLGNVLLDLGERDAAAARYAKAVELQPGYADALAALAGLAEEEHRLDQAMTLAGRALQVAPRNAAARLTRAKVLVRAGETASAVADLQAMLDDPGLSAVNRAIAEGHLGDAFDQRGDYDEAFARYTAANRIQLEQHAETFAKDAGFMSPPTVRRLRSLLREADVGQWQHAPGRGEAEPVFLVGFPRSGTTLLDQVLASHPAIGTLEERPALVDACAALLAPGAGAREWAHLAPAVLAELQEQYLARVSQCLGEAPRRPVLIDKFPLNAILLPVIARVFPDARVILALRDPRDVVLSCYQQRFGMNGAMYQLLRLDTAAAFYDEVMNLVAECREQLPLRVHEVRYEQVVGDFDATVGQLLAFLGLPWSDAVRDFAATARQRVVSTPSAAQVVRPLYSSSRGRWRNYRRFLEPVLPVLAPWVAAYGYEDSRCEAPTARRVETPDPG
jgi:tetratricopeptide (TPR) repeat protein